MSIALYILNPLLLLLLCWLLWRLPYLQSIKEHFLPALGLKLIAGVALGLLYHHYYHEGDTLTFQKASLVLAEYAKQDFSGYVRLIFFNEFESEVFRATVPFSRFPGFSNSFFFIKLLSLLNLFTNSHYYLNSLYLSLFSFWGTATLVTTLAKCFPKYKNAAVLAFLYFPSVVFWSAGVLKDAILFGSMCWIIATTLELVENRRASIITWLLLPFILYFFVRIKFFLALVLLPLLVLYFLVRVLAKKFSYLKPVKNQALVLIAGMGMVALVGLYLVTNYNEAFFFQNLVYTYSNILELSQGRPHIQFQSLEPTLPSILANAPEALLSAVYRPFIWEKANALYFLMSLENLFVLVLSVLAVFSFIKNGIRSITLLQVSFVLMIVCFGVILGLTTPNFGTLSRYRIVFLPFLVYLLLQNRYAQQLLEKLRL